MKSEKFNKWWARIHLPEWWDHMNQARGYEITKKAYHLGIKHQKEIEKNLRDYEERYKARR